MSEFMNLSIAVNFAWIGEKTIYFLGNPIQKSINSWFFWPNFKFKKNIKFCQSLGANFPKYIAPCINGRD